MLNKLPHFIRASNTARDTSYLLTATILSNIFGFFIMALLTSRLDPVGFGLFITAFTFSQLIGDLFELGINSGTMNFIPGASGTDKKEYIKASLILKLVTALSVLIGVFLLAEIIAIYAFSTPEMTPYIQASAIGSFLVLLITWAQYLFQAQNKFLSSSIVSTSTNAFRIAAILIVIFLGTLTPLISYIVFQIALILSLGLIFLKFDWDVLKSRLDKNKIKNLLRFGLPIGISVSLSAIYSRLDQLMVFNMLGSDDAGIYGLAYRLTAVLIMAIVAFSSAVVPRFASMAESEFKSYYLKTLYVIFGFAGLILLSMILAPIFIPLIFGNNFKESVIIYQILALGTIFFTFHIPVNNAILFRFKKTKFALFNAILSLGLIWILLQQTIPHSGILGAAWTVAFINFVHLILHLLYYFYCTNQAKGKLNG